jgi:hypothetical protein
MIITEAMYDMLSRALGMGRCIRMRVRCCLRAVPTRKEGCTSAARPGAECRETGWEATEYKVVVAAYSHSDGL